MTMKTITTRALVTVAALSTLLLAVPLTASAAPAPRLGVLGDDIWVMGNNAFCHGAIHVGIDTNPAKRGQATISLTSRGFTGNQPAWGRNPSCKINVAIGYWSGIQYREKIIPMDLGPRPQAPVRVNLRGVGEGINLMSFTTHPNLNKGVSYYVQIP
ncbi:MULTISPECIES: hypothetical protein [Gordonia]|uniref:Uncharacterized protein n=1 Tax=Gordonia amicalis TaxID=89053 RepID=A0AAE4R784_9ACTN|nr:MULTISPECIES: hypothetical protein [Gordonia]KAF0969465.1 hypothetical protein BPODLACK_01746 [Gordonia sp. YY1]MCZ0911720.1 hypothetical protein [Gordonia amicalis]MDJ0455373.1 hypothetical protein [Gordonia amicalis]MDV6310122.1 hypothetical protein [Gordonia amicalis]MDV6314528.1 hypothetical protein [Gordonia amicalis]